MTHTITLYYFPKELRYATPVFFIVALFLVYPGYWIAGLIIAVISVFILTAKYITIIDLQRKQFLDAFGFYWINFVKERKAFRQLERIVITKERYEQNLTSRARSTTMRWSEYTATLVYDDNQKLELVTREDKGDVLEFVKVYSRSLNVAVEDLTSSRS